MGTRSSEPTRIAILSAASRLLEGGGIEAVTLRAVGEEAGVSRGAPYRHFADKAALLQQLAVQTLEGLGQAIRDAAEGKSGQLALQAGCLAYVHYAVDSPNHYLLVFGDTPQADPAPAAEEAADGAMRTIEELVRGIASPSDDAKCPPLREIATVIWVALHGIAQLQITGHLHEPRTLDGATRLDDLVTIFMSSLGAGVNRSDHRS